MVVDMIITPGGLAGLGYLFSLANACDDQAEEMPKKFAAMTAEKAKFYAPKSKDHKGPKPPLWKTIGHKDNEVYVEAYHAKFQEYGTIRIKNGRVYPGDQYKGFAFMRPALDELRGGAGTTMLGNAIKLQAAGAVVAMDAFSIVGKAGTGFTPLQRGMATPVGEGQRDIAAYNKWRAGWARSQNTQVGFGGL